MSGVYNASSSKKEKGKSKHSFIPNEVKVCMRFNSCE
jgi:hypothetical protein